MHSDHLRTFPRALLNELLQMAERAIHMAEYATEHAKHATRAALWEHATGKPGLRRHVLVGILIVCIWQYSWLGTPK